MFRNYDNCMPFKILTRLFSMCGWYSNQFPKCAYADQHFKMNTVSICTGHVWNLFTKYVYACQIKDTFGASLALFKLFSWYVQRLSIMVITLCTRHKGMQNISITHLLIRYLVNSMHDDELLLQLCWWCYTDSEILGVIAF